MVTTKELHDTVQREGILLELKTLPAHINGTYYSIEGLRIILINEDIVLSERLYRSVLAEELGHHFTGWGDTAPRRAMSYRDRTRHERAERAALRWAADTLMPTSPFTAALGRLCPLTLPATAEAFAVEEYLVMVKLEAMAAIRHFWALPGGRMLSLAALPDVHLYDAFSPL